MSNSHLGRRPAGLLAVCALLLVPLLAVPGPMAAAEETKEDKIAERDSVDQELEDLRLQLNDVSEDLADTYLALAETELLIPQAQQDLDDARAELAEAREEDRVIGERLTAAQDEEDRLSGEVEEGQQEVDRSDEDLAQVAISAYKGGDLPSPASVYVGSEDPQDTVDRSMNYELTMSSQGSRLDTLRTDQSVTENSADRLTAVRQEIDDLKVEAEEAVERTAEAEDDAEEAKQELDDLYTDQKNQRDDLEAKKSQYQEDQENLETRSSTLDDEIAELARQEREREEEQRRQQQQQREQDSNGGGGGGESSSGGSTTSSSSGWVAPVDGRQSSSFGWRTHPIWGTSKLHAGDDYPVGCGTPVGAAHSGRVLQNTYNSAAGNKVILSHGIHNGHLVTSSYHHLQSYALPVGATVSAGQTVGYSGTSGSSTGCHLHFETHQDGNAVDPGTYI